MTDPDLAQLTATELAARAKQAVHDGLDPSTIDAHFERAINAKGSDRPLLADWIDVLRQSLTWDQIADRLLDVQLKSDRPIKSILFELQTGLGQNKLRERLGSHYERLRQHPTSASVINAWNAHLTGNAFDTGDLLKCKDGEIETTLGSLIDSFRLIDPDAVRNEETIRSAGLNVDVVRRMKSSFSQIGSDMTDRVNKSFDEDTASNIILRERLSYFKYETLRSGRITIEDPVDGTVLNAFDSIRAFGRTVYTFRGKHLYYLVCGGLGGDAVGLVIPEKSMSVVFLQSNASLLAGANFASLAAALLTRIARNPTPFLEAFERGGRSLEERNIILLIEKTENFAHHMWNFYSSVDHLIALGLDGRIKKVLFSGTEFFGPLDKVFPELAGRFEYPKKHNISDPCPFSETEILVGAGSFFMAPELPARILKANSTAPSQAGFPIIWLGMRLRDKSWVDQIEKLPELIKMLSAEYPHATFLIDGFSLPVGQDTVLPEWSGFFQQMKEAADRIVKNCPMIDVRSLVGGDFGEAARWAARVDVYLAPLGSTQHKVGWFTDAPGLVYASPSFANRSHSTPGAWAAAISTPPIFLIGKGASPGERRGFSRSREKMENVRLNTKQLASIMLMQLRHKLAGTDEPELAAIGKELESLDPDT